MRYFGLRAVIVDFRGEEQLPNITPHELLYESNSIAHDEVNKQQCSNRVNAKRFSNTAGNNGLGKRLLQWVERYFQGVVCNNDSDGAATAAAVFRPPLFLQHQGHSRTIIGKIFPYIRFYIYIY